MIRTITCNIYYIQVLHIKEIRKNRKITNILKYASSSTESFTRVYYRYRLARIDIYIGGIRIRYLFYIIPTVKTIHFMRVDSNTPSIRTATRYYIDVSRLLYIIFCKSCTVNTLYVLLRHRNEDCYCTKAAPHKTPVRWFRILLRAA